MRYIFWSYSYTPGTGNEESVILGDSSKHKCLPQKNGLDPDRSQFFTSYSFVGTMRRIEVFRRSKPRLSIHIFSMCLIVLKSVRSVALMLHMHQICPVNMYHLEWMVLYETMHKVYNNSIFKIQSTMMDKHCPKVQVYTYNSFHGNRNDQISLCWTVKTHNP
jgi:hypothetical protein